MNNRKEKRSSVLPIIRVTASEKERVKTAYLASTYPNQSAYVRAKLLDGEEELSSEKVYNEVLFRGQVADFLEEITKIVVGLIKHRKVKSGDQMDKKEMALLLKALRTIQQIQSEINPKTEK